MTESKCTDPRDRIYATLSISEIAAHIKPDYSLSYAEIYKSAALADIKYRKNLNILASCDGRRTLPGSPSWVPDFATKPESMLLIWTGTPNCASGPALMRRKLCVNADVLKVGGKSVFVVTSVEQLDSNPDRRQFVTDANLHRMIPDDLLERDYVGGGSLWEAYCYLFCCGVFRDRFIPTNMNLPTLEEAKHVLVSILNNDKNCEAVIKRKFRIASSGLHKVRAFFHH